MHLGDLLELARADGSYCLLNTARAGERFGDKALPALARGSCFAGYVIRSFRTEPLHAA
jgi:hypothetical protein